MYINFWSTQMGCIHIPHQQQFIIYFFQHTNYSISLNRTYTFTRLQFIQNLNMKLFIIRKEKKDSNSIFFVERGKAGD